MNEASTKGWGGRCFVCSGAVGGDEFPSLLRCCESFFSIAVVLLSGIDSSRRFYTASSASRVLW